jgi:hypothetical protein
MWNASQVSLKTKYFIKVVVGLIIMQTALVLMARTGVGIYALPLSFLFALSVARVAEDTAYLGAIRDAADCYESLSGGPGGICVSRYLDDFSRVELRLRDRCDADGSSVSTRLTGVGFLGPAAARH